MIQEETQKFDAVPKIDKEFVRNNKEFKDFIFRRLAEFDEEFEERLEQLMEDMITMGTYVSTFEVEETNQRFIISLEELELEDEEQEPRYFFEASY